MVAVVVEGGGYNHQRMWGEKHVNHTGDVSCMSSPSLSLSLVSIQRFVARLPFPSPDKRHPPLPDAFTGETHREPYSTGKMTSVKVNSE